MKRILFILSLVLVFGNIGFSQTTKYLYATDSIRLGDSVYHQNEIADTGYVNRKISEISSGNSDTARYSNSSGIAFKFIGDTLILGNDTITEIHNVTDTTIRFRVNGQNIILATSSGGGGGISSVTYSDFEQDVIDTINLKLAASIFNAHRDSTEKHFLQSEISITASQVSDFDTEVSNNTDVQANTSKRSYPVDDSTKLAGIESGAQVNTIDAGDNVSGLVNDVGYLTSEIQVLSISNDTIFLTGGSFVKLPASSGGTIDTSYIYAAIAAKQDTTVTDTSLSTRYDSLYIKVCNETLDTCDYLLVVRDNVLGTSDSVLYANNADSLGGLSASSYLTAEVDGSVTNEIQVISISNDTIFLSDGGFVKLPTSAGGDFDTTNIYQVLGSKQDTIAWDTSLTTTQDTLLLLVYSRDLQTKDTIKVIKGELAAEADSVLFAEKSGNSDSLGGVAASSYLRTSGNLNWNDTILNVEAAFGNNIIIGSTTNMQYGSAFNTVLGYNAGINAGTDADWNTIIGYQSGITLNGTFNTLLGGYSGNYMTTGRYNTIIGHGAGELITTGDNNTFVGYEAGRIGGGNGDRSGCVFIGYQAGVNITVDNALAIDNSLTSSPLLYGNFSTDSLAVNGTLTATGTVTAGALNINSTDDVTGITKKNDSTVTMIVDGTSIDLGSGGGSGSTSDSVLFANNAGSLGGVVAGSYLKNSGDTASDLTINSLKILGRSVNMGNSTTTTVAIGIGALNNYTSGNDITALGYGALLYSTSATDNTAIGAYALRDVTTGGDNVAIGDKAGLRTNGSFNIFIGDDAGSNITSGDRNVIIGHNTDYETGSVSDKLVIDNSNTANPLIEGYFNKDSLEINGSLNVTGTVTAGAFSSAFITDTYAASKTVDMSTGQKHKMTVSGDMTINFTNIVEGVVYTFHFYQDGTGGHTITLGTWNSGSAYPLENTGDFDTDASDMTKLQFEYDGTNIIYGITNSNL